MSISVFCLLCRLVGTAVSQPPVNLTFCSFDVTESVMGTKSTSSAILYYSVYSIIHPHASRSKVCDSIKQQSTFIFLTADYVSQVTASISLQQVVPSFYRSRIDLKYLDTLTVLSHISLFCFSHRVEVVTETGGCLSSEDHAKHLSLSATLCS